MQSDLVTQTLYQISSAVNSAGDLNHLYQKIHQSLSNIIDVTNFYIALYEPHEEVIHFPYFIDELSKITSGFKYSAVERPGSLTSLVIQKGEPVFLKEQNIKDYVAETASIPSGPISKAWIGVPLKINQSVIGIIAVQSYTNPDCYDDNDLQLLSMVSDQIAIAIDRKKSLKRFQNLLENIHDIVYTTNSIGKITYLSPAVTALTGYLPDEVINTFRWNHDGTREATFNALIHPSHQQKIETLINDSVEKHSSFECEYRLLKKDGTSLWVYDRGQFFKDDMDNVYLEGIITNIQERKRAEEINLVLYEISNAINVTHDLDELYKTIHEALKTVINVERFAILLFDKQMDRMTVSFSTEAVGVEFPKMVESSSTSASLAAEVIRHGKAIIFDKKEMIQFARNRGAAVPGTPTESWLGVPLSVKGEIIGAMLTETFDATKAYTTEDIECFTSVSEQIAIAIERKLNEEQIKIRERVITSLYKISNSIHTTKSLKQLYQSIHEALSDIIEVQHIAISLYDRDRDVIEFQYTSDNVEETIQTPIKNASASGSLTYNIIHEEKSILMTNLDEQLIQKDQISLASDVAYPKCWLGVPLKGKDKILGGIIVQSYSDPYCYNEKDVALLESVSEQIAFAIEYKESESNLVSAQAELLEKAHKAGMADIASDTLHNLGNLLNSAKISNESIQNALQYSDIASFSKAILLLKKNIDRLPEFISSDPNGIKLMIYLVGIEQSLKSEFKHIDDHTRRLTEKIELMINVIRTQQNYVYEEFMEENCLIEEVVDKLLGMHEETFKSMGVSVVKDYEQVPKIVVQKSKLEFIIMNILNNAKDSMERNTSMNKALRVSLDQDADYIYLRFKDDGEGIARENLQKIFSHGFTTKPHGHGFGLHNAANFLSDMRGKIWAESEGQGRGATFIVGLRKKT